MKKAMLLTAILGLLLTSGLAAQTPGDTLWTRTYGGANDDRGWSVRQTSDDGYIIVGWTDSFGAGGYDIYLIKTDATGDTLWTRVYGGEGSDDGRSVQQTSDGGYIVAGNTQLPGVMGCDIYLIKTDAMGDTLWTNSWGETTETGTNNGRCVQQTSDGGYVVAGFSQFLGTNDEDVYLIKTDAGGGTEWIKSYGGTGFETGYWVQQTSDSGYIVVGYTLSFGSGNEDVYLVKTNASGDTLWTRTYGGPGTDSGYSVQQTSDNGYIIAGFTDSFGAGSYDVYLIKTDAMGDTVWTRTYGGTGFDKGYSVDQIADGSYIVSGVTKSFGAGSGDVYLLKVDAFGDTLWTRTYGGTDDERGWSVQETSDGSYIVGGYTGVWGGYDVYLLKIAGGQAGVEEDNHSIAVDCGFIRNCPNPFNPQTTINFNLPQAGPVSLSIYDVTGQLVRRLIANERYEAGSHSMQWDGRNLNGTAITSGIYFCRLKTGTFSVTRRMTMLK